MERHRGVAEQLAVDRVAELLVAAPASCTDVGNGDAAAEGLQHDVLAACRTFADTLAVKKGGQKVITTASLPDDLPSAHEVVAAHAQDARRQSPPVFKRAAPAVEFEGAPLGTFGRAQPSLGSKLAPRYAARS